MATCQNMVWELRMFLFGGLLQTDVETATGGPATCACARTLQIKEKKLLLDHTRTHRDAANKLQAEIQRADEDILDGEEKIINLEQQIRVGIWQLAQCLKLTSLCFSCSS